MIFCPICQSTTKLLTTQTNASITHPLPIEFRELSLIRRRRACLKEKSHRFWTLELSQEFWEKVLERSD